MVGDQAFAFLLMKNEMYFSMSSLQPANLIVDRGIALHKVHLSCSLKPSPTCVSSLPSLLISSEVKSIY